MSIDGKKSSWLEQIVQHGLVFLFCIIFPGLTTFFAPASWIMLHRSGDSVECTTRTCVFFVVPFRVQSISNVDRVESRVREAHTEKKRKYGRPTRETVQVEGEGHIQLVAPDDQYVEVSVSPASLESVKGKLVAFLQDSTMQSKTVFAIANWKFGAIMGGVLTSFTVLYVVGYSLAFIQQLIRLGKRMLPGDHQRPD